MKKLDDWMQDSFTAEERSEIAADVEREARALAHARELSRRIIDDIMKERHIGFNEFARQARLSPSHLSAIINGKSSPSLATLAKIAAAFGKEFDLSLS